MSVTQPDTFSNALLNTNIRQLANVSLKRMMAKCQGKFDCLVFEMLFIKKLKPNLSVQTDSIRAKLFVLEFYIFIFVTFSNNLFFPLVFISAFGSSF